MSPDTIAVAAAGLAVFLGGMGLLVWLRASERRVGRTLGGVLVMTAISEGASSLGESTVFAPHGVPALQAVDQVAVCIVPPLLFLAASALGGRRVSRWGLASIWGTTAAIAVALLVTWRPDGPVQEAWPLSPLSSLALAAWTSAALWRLLAAAVQEDRPARRDWLARCLPTLGFLMVVRLALVGLDLEREAYPWGTLPGPLTGTTIPLILLAAMALGLEVWKRLRVPPGTPAERGVGQLLGLLGLVALAWSIDKAFEGAPAISAALASWRYILRWFIFAVVFTQDVRLYGLLDLTDRVSRWIGRAAAAVVLVAGTGLAWAALDGAGLMDVWPALATAIAIALFVAIALSVLPRLAGSWDHVDKWEAAKVFRAHAEVEQDPERLELVRRRLGLPAGTARRLLAALDAERTVPAMPGTEVVTGQLFRSRYAVGALIDADSRSSVYLAQDRREGRPVVLKVVRDGPRADGGASRRELRAIVSIVHPNLVRFHGFERMAGARVLVFEHVMGPTLRDTLASGPLAPVDVASLAHGLLAALDAVHRAGFTHCDVKPENIILHYERGVVLLDLGSSSEPAGRTLESAHDGIQGTLGYMSPEQLRGAPVGPASDVFSAGVVLWEAMTGTRDLRAPVPAVWRSVLAKAMAEHPEARWRTARQFAAAIPVVAQRAKASHAR